MNVGHNGGPRLPDPHDEGYILAWRRQRDHHLVGWGPQVRQTAPHVPARGFCTSRYEAWQDLIMECRYADGKLVNKGRVILLRRGQLLGGTMWLAQRWNWSPKAVRVWLDALEADGMIDPPITATEAQSRIVPNKENNENWGKQKGNPKSNQVRVISICNYNVYQASDGSQRQAPGPDEGQARGKRGASAGQHNKKGRREEEEDADQRTREFDRLQRRLTAACNGTLADHAIAPGLLSLATPLMWLEQGCDLERDILPTLTAVSHKTRSKIKNWTYFTRAVAEAKARREQGLPAVDLATTERTTNARYRDTGTQFADAFAKLDARLARARAGDRDDGP